MIRNKNKTVLINIRATEEEKAKLEEKASIYAGGNLSGYIRKLLYPSQNSKIKTLTNVDRKDLYALIREINHIGNNLNQLTKLANEGRALNTSIEKSVEEVKKKMDDLSEFIVEQLQF